MLLPQRHQLPDFATKKWKFILLNNFQFQWADTWEPSRARKEATLIWQLWHKAIAVNAWRGRISPDINQMCLMCDAQETETAPAPFLEL